ncbi:MAG: methyltransferase domain-containing protein [Burkholderiaceae bacterium]|nr:methyltransferase domain-containing protein [Burkholderiaceae bacterium]
MADIQRYDYAFDPQGESLAARCLRQLPASGAAVLELGPGPGAMTKWMLDGGYQITAVENDPGALALLRALNGVAVIDADLDEGHAWRAALGQRQFDAVLACDVLEHLRRPEQVLRDLRACLKPHGRLIISVPNIAYAGVVAALRAGLFDYTDAGLLDRTHVRFFTRRSLESVLLECGWVPQSWQAYRVPVEKSEFAACWQTLTDEQRLDTARQWSEFDVYEWLVTATTATDSAAADVVRVHQDARQAREALQALTLRYEEEHASLLDHQKAFAEARQIIANFEAEAARKDEQLRALTQTVQTAQVALQAAQKKSFWRWLRGGD